MGGWTIPRKTMKAEKRGRRAREGGEVEEFCSRELEIFEDDKCFYWIVHRSYVLLL